jgi:hypothetical protein
MITSRSKRCQELKKWLDPEYVIIDFSRCESQQTPPAFKELPQDPLVPFFEVAGMSGVYQVETRGDGLVVLGRILQLFPGSSGTLITTAMPLSVF